MKPIRYLIAIVVGLAILAYAPRTEADDPPASTVALMEMSLEELMNIEVTIVSKRVQPLFESPAAAYVITAEDIRRAGARSIPEALRMVPGLHVAQTSSSQWVVTSRGFSHVFSNKLLVLIDGRSVYTPLFAGVHWDVQDLFIEDVERIEVVRGPGATLWGANAVNGVINIVTTRAEDSQGTLVSLEGSSENRATGAIRHGGEMSPSAHYRVYAKGLDHDRLVDSPGDDESADWNLASGGFRIDMATERGDDLTFQGNLYSGDIGLSSTVDFAIGDVSRSIAWQEDVTGGNFLTRWTRRLTPRSGMTLQMYYDRTERRRTNSPENRDVIDLDAQHDFRLSDRQMLVWGVGYRYIHDRVVGNSGVFVTPESRNDQLFSAFVQDEIAAVQDHLYITVGSKFEHNDYTGFELQPSARLMWTPADHHAAWAAASRAVRTPSRVDHNFEVDIMEFSGAGGMLNTVTLLGNPEFESEVMHAYELGYRVQPAERFVANVTAFYNDYSNVSTIEMNGPFLDMSGAQPKMIVPLAFYNNAAGVTYGIELDARWSPTDAWTLGGGYTEFEMNMSGDLEGMATIDRASEGDTPGRQLHLRSFFDVHARMALDTALYYVGELTGRSTPSYLRTDVRLGWSPSPIADLGVGVRNLFDDRHLEYVSTDDVSVAHEIKRTFFGEVNWHF